MPRLWGYSSDCRFRMLDWVVVGGESGPKARPMHPDWVRSLRDQCLAANVPFFFKQWGEWLPGSPGHHNWINWQDGSQDNKTGVMAQGFVDGETVAARVGKKAAGRLLDGYTWDGMP